MYQKIWALVCAIIFVSTTADAQTRSPAGQGSQRVGIFQLPLFERAVRCIKFYEGMHTEKDFPYVGYGHRIQPGEKFPKRLNEKQADSLLRADLQRLCQMYRGYGKDSLLLAVLSYNVGCGRVSGNGKNAKSRLLSMIERGYRNIYQEYISFCRWKGRVIPSIKRRRMIEYRLLFQP